jgi:hypothetical protein
MNVAQILEWFGKLTTNASSDEGAECLRSHLTQCHKLHPHRKIDLLLIIIIRARLLELRKHLSLKGLLCIP